MGKKKKHERLTIEKRLENYHLEDKKSERNEILWHAWCQNKRWLSQLLETTMSSFPTYSKHDESHARTVLHNIEMILGEKRIWELSASDCFMLLHTVYIHDIGMVITYEDREEIVQNEEFVEMVKLMEDDNDPVFQRAIKALQRREYVYDDEDSKEEQAQKLYSDKLAVYYAILHLISTFRRTEHGRLSNERLTEWTLKTEKLGAGFSMAGIPQRIFLWIAKCAGLHTDYEFKHILDLPQEDNGYASDYVHPRFIAVLLQLGDILDMDNDRFYPLTKECIGTMPEMSERHYEKHQSIRRLYIKPDIISIEADCSTQDALRLVRKECDMLKEILKEAGYNWSQICPPNFRGALPTIESVKLYLKGAQIPEELVATQFRITQKKAFSILEGSNVYEGQFVFLREFLQNAIDASKIQYWNECIRTRGYYNTKDEMKNMSPDNLEEILSTDIFPIEIEMQIVKRDEDKKIFSISKEDVEQLQNIKKTDSIDGSDGEQPKKRKKTDWQYGVKVRIKDFGTGIDKESIKNIANVGNSRKKERSIINEMPEWLKPTAEFGIGLQSAFLLTNMFKCYTYTRSNEKYEITFSTVKSNYYEGYINVHPTEKFNSKDDAYGTCFEVFVPYQKKLKHERYKLAWDGKDYFDEDYETLRPLRHSAELLAQMALYLDGLIGEQMFPIHLNVIPNDFVPIPLNISDKNRIRNLKYKLGKEVVEENALKANILSEWEREDADKIKEVFQKRIWHQNGKSWIYYYNKYKNGDKGENKEIILERTEKAVALLDNKDGHLYFWDNELCTFGLINMENFLLLERQKTENRDKNCENMLHGVRLYYKGIELEEKELPGIGNELFQYIDIKGKLEREYINLSRKGFTERGETYFLNQIYYPLLESVQKTLTIINKKHSAEVVEGIQNSLNNKREALEILSAKIGEVNKKWKYDYISESKAVQRQELLVYLTEIRQKLIMMYKEHAISATMLSFFAQKACLDLVTQIGTEKESEKETCWKKIVEMVGNNSGIENNGERQDPIFDNSVLFHIEHRPAVNLMSKGWKEGNSSGVITFPDIFSDKNQFMVVSKREDQSAPWKQYLTPIWQKGENAEEENVIYLLRQYFTMDSRSSEKTKVRDKILDMGENALRVAQVYGINAYGESGAMSPGEYLQQYFLKWLLLYIPTVALFMSEDGNVRVNIIFNQIFPFVFMNDAAKKLILSRIMQDTKRYGIKRFSIPAWQGLEYLSCEELPYSHYFVKRGYLSEESYSKVIFPFDGNELLAISNRINSWGNLERIKYLKELFEVLNIRKHLIKILPEADQRMEKMINTINAEEKKNLLRKAYRDFRKDFEEGGRRTARVFDRVRVNYRKIIAGMIETSRRHADTIELPAHDNMTSAVEKWEKVYLYLLVVTISNEYDIELSKTEFPLPKNELESLGMIWTYIIKKQYLQNATEMLQYEKEYLYQMEQGKGATFAKRERILSFIVENRCDRMKKEFLTTCWMQYVKEIFRLFKVVETDQFRVLEEFLPDKTGIERGMSYKDKEGTQDANN